MGTWAHYDVLDDTRLRTKFWDFPKRIPEAQWVEMLAKSAERETKRLLDFHLTGCMAGYDDPAAPAALKNEHPDRAKYESMMCEKLTAQAKSEADADRQRLLTLECVPTDPDGNRIVDTSSDAAQVVFRYVCAECSYRHLHTFDVIYDAANEHKIGRHLTGEKEPAREVWTRFLCLVGYPECREEMPWWVNASYPERHYLGIISADKARALAKDIEANNLAELASETLGKHIVDVFDLIAWAAEDNRTVIAIESDATV